MECHKAIIWNGTETLASHRRRAVGSVFVRLSTQQNNWLQAAQPEFDLRRDGHFVQTPPTEISAAFFGISHTERESNLSFPANVKVGRAVAQAVNRRLPNAAVRVWARVKWDLWWTKQVFSEYFGFPCLVFHWLLHIHHHPSSSGAGTVCHFEASVIMESVPLHSKK
jgi:hypothetical protein